MNAFPGGTSAFLKRLRHCPRIKMINTADDWQEWLSGTAET